MVGVMELNLSRLMKLSGGVGGLQSCGSDGVITKLLEVGWIQCVCLQKAGSTYGGGVSEGGEGYAAL